VVGNGSHNFSAKLGSHKNFVFPKNLAAQMVEQPCLWGVPVHVEVQFGFGVSVQDTVCLGMLSIKTVLERYSIFPRAGRSAEDRMRVNSLLCAPPHGTRNHQEEKLGLMTDTPIHFANANLQLQKRDDAPPPSTLNRDKTSRTEEGKYVAVSPTGAHVQIPKELFVALQDFMKTRKNPGSITIQFRDGDITCVEAVAKKTYRGP